MMEFELLLEKHIIENWGECPDANIVRVAENLSNEGIPTAISYYNRAYYVLVNQGQGPVIAEQAEVNDD